jgi:hypothetical protein
MITTLFLLLWLIPIAVNIYTDRKGRKPNYLQMFIIRGMAAILHGILFNPHNMLDYLPVFIFQVTSFWVLFEIGLNIIRKKPLLYYDQKELDSGILDRFFAKRGTTIHLIAKIVAVLLCILSVIVIYNK